MLASDGLFRRVNTRQWLALAAGGAVLAALWWFTQPVPDGVVNNSHPMHLFVGRGVARRRDGGTGRVAIGGTAIRVSRPMVRFLSQRSLTVYLWHTTAIVAALWFVNRSAQLALRRMDRFVPRADRCRVSCCSRRRSVGSKTWRRAARQGCGRSRRLRARRGALGRESRHPSPSSSIVALALPTSPTAQVESGVHPARSFAGAAAAAGRRPGADRRPEGALPISDPQSMQDVVDTWELEFDLRGVSVSVAAPDGEEFTSAIGEHDDGTQRSVDDRLDVMSVTKLFTANLVYRAVDSGLLDLDAPVPAIAAEPEFPYAGQMTVRQLLAHRSGDRELPRQQPLCRRSELGDERFGRHRVERGRSVGVTAGRRAPVLEHELSGARPAARTGHGRRLRRVAHERVARCRSAWCRPPISDPIPASPASQPRAWSPICSDLGRAGLALLRDHVGVSDESYAQMQDIDVDSGMGPGLNGFCPCERRFDGGVHWFGLGYTGGNTLLAYVPDADVVVDDRRDRRVVRRRRALRRGDGVGPPTRHTGEPARRRRGAGLSGEQLASRQLHPYGQCRQPVSQQVPRARW